MSSEKPVKSEVEVTPELVVETSSGSDSSHEVSTSEPADKLAPGLLFAQKYEIIAHLGSGGAGDVYKARDIAINRIVALKIVNRDHAMNEKALLRFQQEARAAGALNHPGIVGVHELAAEDETPYLVMDFVDGSDAAKMIRQDELSLDRVLSLIIQCAKALQHAHSKGIVHRDIKPSNLIVSDDAEVPVKIVDFGIAKLTASEGQDLTQTGEIFGSPLYMSPEQCSGAKVDARSDIYSLGCVLYEMLTGKPPHAGDSPLTTAVKHIMDAPKPLNAMRADLPAGLQQVVDRALAKDVSARYQSMSEFAGDLAKIQSGKPPVAVAVPRRRPRFMAGFLILALLTVSAYFLLGRQISLPGLLGDDPETHDLDILDGDAMNLIDAKRYDQAATLLKQQFVEKYKEDGNALHGLYMALCYSDLAEALAHMRRYEDAQESYRNSLRMFGQFGQLVPPWQFSQQQMNQRLSVTVDNYAQLLRSIGNEQAAQSLLDDWAQQLKSNSWPRPKKIP